MKKQTKTYILLGVVLFIWGVIGFQIYSSFSPTPVGNELTGVSTFQPKKIKEREQFTIVANYRDPFLGTLPSPKIKKRKKHKPSIPREPLPEIKYTGYITDTSTQGKIYFISMGGRQYMLSPKEKVGDMTLVSGTASRIKVRYKNKLRTIQLEE